MRRLDSVTNAMNMNLEANSGAVRDREAWRTAVTGLQRAGTTG